MSSYRPKIKTNSDGTVSDLALDAETVKGHSVPTSGNASSNQIVLGNDTRLNANVTDVKMNGTSVVSNSVANVNATPVSVMPANEGQIKTKFRTCLYGFSNYQNHYYKLCTLPATSDNNYASVIISGRIGGWTAVTMSYIRCIAWNRGGAGISIIDMAAGGSMADIFYITDIEMYQNNNNTVSIYAHVNGFFTFDFDIETFQDSVTIDFDGTVITTPEGTLVAKASTCTNRLELEQGNLKVGGTPVAKTSDLGDQVKFAIGNLYNFNGVTWQNVTSDGYSYSGRVFGEMHTFLKAGTYTMKTDLPSTYRFAVVGAYYDRDYFNSDPSAVAFDSGWQSAQYYTFTLTTDVYMGLYFKKADDSNLVPNDIKVYNYQIKKGTLAEAFPNLLETSKNISVTENYVRNDIRLLVGSTYTFSITGGVNSGQYALFLYKNGSEVQSITGGTSYSSSYTFTVTEDSDQFVMYANNLKSANLMLNAGDIALPYEDYIDYEPYGTLIITSK